jgi:hypothetical protein
MAKRVDIKETIFAGETKTLRYRIFNVDGVTPVDVLVGGWTFQFQLFKGGHFRDAFTVAGEAVLEYTSPAISIFGAFDADPAVNAQRVLVALAADDTEHLSSGLYSHVLWRTDSRQALTYGTLPLVVVPV